MDTKMIYASGIKELIKRAQNNQEYSAPAPAQKYDNIYTVTDKALNFIRSKIKGEKQAEVLPPYTEGEDPLVTQYREDVRRPELLGTGLGALAGGSLGALLGPSKYKIPLGLAGLTGGGLLGKFLGRRHGELKATNQLSEALGIPLELENSSYNPFHGA
jgi:uncharacterized protein YcfJ